MHWLITFAALCAFNKTVLSWKAATPRGQVSCDSRLQCLLLMSSQSDASKKTSAPRDMNTWYPMPKWKVIFQANKNRNEYSEPYFNKQDPTRTDGNIQDNDFSPGRRGEVFERLNIQFLPLKDGNVTVRREGVNESVSEYVALFVIYAHSTRIDIRKVQNNSDKGTLSLDLEMKTINGSENTSALCEGLDMCVRQARRMFLPNLVNDSMGSNRFFTNNSNMIMMPIAKNMTIEMKTHELDDNYTAVIIPFTDVLNKTKDANEFKLAMHSEGVYIPMSKNMNLLVKMEDIFRCNKSFNDSNCFTPNDILNSSLIHNNELSKSKITGEKSDSVYDQIIPQNNKNNFTQDFKLLKYPNSLENDSINTSLYDNNPTSTESSFNSITSNFIFNENSASSTAGLHENGKDERIVINPNITVDVPLPNITVNVSKSLLKLDESFLMDKRLNYHKNDTAKIPNITTHEEIYKKKLGPFQVKEIQSDNLPFIAKIELIINNKEIENQESDKLTSFEIFYNSHSRNGGAPNSNITGILQRQKRHKINETSGSQHNASRSGHGKKMKTVNDENKTVESYIHPDRSPRVILNKTEELNSAAGAMNHGSLILPRGFGEEQNNSSRLFLFSGGTGSYSYTTISNGNEEFNQNHTGKFGNKGLISNEISDKPVGVDGVKSNQTVHGFRNKRELALPTLIPGRDSRENHSVLKKSELQIAAESSLDKNSNDWKMKIPPGHLRRNGIKMGKICDLRDGCKGINDVFNSMTKSEHYEEEDVRKESFGAIESFDDGGEKNTTDKIEFPNYHFMRKMSERAIDMKVLNNRGSGLVEERSKFNSSQKNPISDASSSNLNIQRDVLSIRAISNQFSHDQKDKMNLKHGFLKPRVEIVDSSSEKVKSKRMEGNEKLNFRFPTKINAQIFSQAAKNLLRKKRSQSETNSNFHPGHSFYLMNLNNYPQLQAQSVHQNVSPYMNNASLPNFRNDRQDIDRDWQEYLSYLRHKVSNEDGEASRSSNTFQTQPESKIKEWWFKRGSGKRQRVRQNKLIPNNEQVIPSLGQNIHQGYRWVILMPEASEQQRPKPPVSTRKSIYNLQPGQTFNSPNREREGEDWLRNEWILVNVDNSNGKNLNERIPSINPTSFDIINMPRAVTNLQTTAKPTVRSVSSTTQRPVSTSTTRSTTKATVTIPPSTPNPRTTSNPWSVPTSKPWSIPTSKPWPFDDPWDIRWSSNYWTVSQNPWKKYPTRPPMMMGGMAGGD